MYISYTIYYISSACPIILLMIDSKTADSLGKNVANNKVLPDSELSISRLFDNTNVDLV